MLLIADADIMCVVVASATNMRIRIWWTGEIVFLVKCNARLLCECFQALEWAFVVFVRIYVTIVIVVVIIVAYVCMNTIVCGSCSGGVRLLLLLLLLF